MPEYTLIIRVIGKDDASPALGRVQSSLGGIATIAGGILASRIFMRVAEGIKNIATQAFDAAAEFQALQIRMEGLIAREYVQIGVAEDMAEALGMAVIPAQELLEWIKELAVTTPFTVQNLTRTLSLAQAMGFTTEEAKRLTLAIGNFTAGMGLTDEVMWRVIYNFGQMVQQGKVTGTELRDLARGAMVPVTDVLREMQEQLGLGSMEFDDFRKAAAKGKYGVEEFFEAFITIANRDFPGAMERMALTWKGVTQNVTDFIQAVLGVDLLGPVVDRFAVDAAEALQKMMTPEMRAQFKEWGEALGDMYDRLKEKLEGLPEAWENFKLKVLEVLVAIGEKLGISEEDWGRLKEAVQPFIDTIKEFWEQHGPKVLEILGQIGLIILGVSGFFVALGIASLVFGKIAVLLGILFHPISLLIAAVYLAYTAWTENWGGIQEIVGTVVEWVKGKIEVFKAWWDKVWPSISAFLQTAWWTIQTVFEAAWAAIEPVIESFKAAWEEMEPLLGPIIERVKGFFSGLWELIKRILPVIGAIIIGVIAVIVGVIRGLGEALAWIIEKFTFVAEGIIRFAEGVVDTFVAFWDILKALITGNTELLTDAMDRFWEGLKDMFWGGLQAILSFIIGVLGGIWKFISGWVEGVYDFFKSLFSKLIGGSLIPDMLSRISAAFTDFISEVLTNIKEWVANIISTITGKIGDMVNAGKDLLTGFWSGLKGVWRRIWRWLSGVVKDIVRKFKEALGLGSESRLFRGFGMDMMKGLETGIRKGMVGPARAMDRLERTILPSAGIGVGGKSYVVHNTFYIDGAGNPEAVAEAIMQKLRQQGVAVY